MPNRILKESINESLSLSETSFFAEDLYKRLITYADDYGRFNADAQIILARLYPREIGIVSESDIEGALTELIGAEKIAFYTSDARREIYGCFPRWAEHQNIRTVKSKYPDPTDTSVNDYYLRRFIPYEMKVAIIERDGFKCAMCKKYVCTTPTTAERLIKMGAGLFDFDHIVPVVQGGRATMENLRLTCPHCNRSRKKRLTAREIIQISKDLSQSVSTCDNLQQIETKCCLNPIQSESNPNPNPNSADAGSASVKNDLFDRFWSAYPKKIGKGAAQKAFEKAHIGKDLIETVLKAIDQQKNTDQWKKDGGQYIPNPATWLNQQRWEDEVTVKTNNPKPSYDMDIISQRFALGNIK